MPELPEVEVIRRQAAALVGHVVTDAWARGEDRFATAADVRGTVTEVGRCGKFLLVGLDGMRWLVVHLGMTGRLELVDGSAGRTGRHVCAWWALDDGRDLVLVDPRRFGRAVCCGDPGEVLPAMGPDLLDESFDHGAFADALTASRRGAKDLLLSQRLVAGVGNYLCDESLWRARIGPLERGVDRDRGLALAAALVGLALDSIAAGGATMRDYRSLDGAGRSVELLRCYGRAGQGCDRCATTLVRATVVGRGTTYCPRCQGLGR